MAIRGPQFLRNFRRPTERGFWAMVFSTALFIPLAYFYTEFYNSCNWGDAGCSITEWLNGQKASFQRDELQGELVTMLGVMGLGLVLAGMFQMLWFFRVSSNLIALGVSNRRFHSIILFFSLVSVVIGLIIVLFSVFGVVLILAGLILPLFMFQEVWRGSNPNFLGANSNWQKTPRSFMISSWWLLSLLFPILIVLPFLSPSLNGRIQESWFFLGLGLVAGYWFLSMLLIIRINRRQLSKFKAWAQVGSI